MLKPFGWERSEGGLFGFWLRFGSVTGFFGTCAFAKASPKPKNPRSERLHYFFKRSITPTHRNIRAKSFTTRTLARMANASSRCINKTAPAANTTAKNATKQVDVWRLELWPIRVHP